MTPCKLTERNATKKVTSEKSVVILQQSKGYIMTLTFIINPIRRKNIQENKWTLCFLYSLFNLTSNYLPLLALSLTNLMIGNEPKKSKRKTKMKGGDTELPYFFGLQSLSLSESLDVGLAHISKVRKKHR